MTDSRTPTRIVSLQPSATVVLASLGALDRVVACTRYCSEVVPGIKGSDQLIIADSWSAKSAEILRAKPDLVIAAVPYQEQAVVEILKTGVRFLGLAPRCLNDIYSDIAIIAALVGASDRGTELISQMQKEIEIVTRATASLPRRRVFCEEWGKPIIASQRWVQELVHAAGGEFVGAAGRQISAEDVARLDPEIVIAAWCGAGNRVPLEKIIRDRGWSQTAAAQQSQVYCISDELLNTPAPTLITGLHALAAVVHPAAVLPSQLVRNRIRRIFEGSPSEIITEN